MGKELAIDPKNNEDAFRDESVQNPKQWKKFIDSGWAYDQVGGFNPLLPYNGE